jgi:lia operon protein LiaF
MHSSIVHRMFWGMVIVAVGVIFLLNQTGIITIDIGEFISVYWPVFIIFFGLQGLLIQREGVFWWNPLVILIGFFFLGRNLNWFEWSFSDMIRIIGPIALILFGVSIIFQGNRRLNKPDAQGKSEQWNPITPPIPSGPPPTPPELDEFEHRNSHNVNNPFPPVGPDLSKQPLAKEIPPQTSNVQLYGWKRERQRQRHDHKDEWKAHDWHNPNRENHSRFIWDVHLGNEYWELRPMSISHFIGDTTLDLTKAQIPIGETRIYVSSFIGDVKVFVPNDLGVGIQVTSSCLIGDVKVLDQKRGGIFNQMSVETPSFADTDKRVVLVVSSFIGDVRVTKVG